MRARILFVDDSDSDIELLLRRLRCDGIEPESSRVADVAALREALAGPPWDVALVDYNIPGYGGLDAMRVIAEESPETPMITVSGAIDEETAVATLTAGAVDYVLKDNLTRLAPAVERAIAGGEARRDLRRRSDESRKSVAALRESEERFAAFGRHLPGYLYMLDETGRYIYSNDRVLSEGDIPPEMWIGQTPQQLWPMEEAEVAAEAFRRALAGEVVDFVETWHIGTRVEHLHSLYFPIQRDGRPPLVGGLALDVSELVAAEEEVRRTTEQLRQSAEHLRQSLEGTMLAMSQIVETRDPYTAGHQRRVAELAVAIAREMAMSEECTEGLRIAAAIHDIGKILVPAEILTKPGRISEVEFNLIKQHSLAGHDILAGIHFERPVAEIVLQHHERLDGSGYPSGLEAAAILPEAHILAVADVVEAMSSHRPYRAALGIDAALAELEAGAGTLYAPDVAAACLRVVRDQSFAFSD